MLTQALPISQHCQLEIWLGVSSTDTMTSRHARLAYTQDGSRKNIENTRDNAQYFICRDAHSILFLNTNIQILI